MNIEGIKFRLNTERMENMLRQQGWININQLPNVEEIRLFLISNLDFFREWAERSYKNTNDMKHENTSDIIERFAKSIHSLMRERMGECQN